MVNKPGIPLTVNLIGENLEGLEQMVWPMKATYPKMGRCLNISWKTTAESVAQHGTFRNVVRVKKLHLVIV